jgi:hypothetical protein
MILLGIYIGISIVVAILGFIGYCLGGRDDSGLFLECVIVVPLFWPFYLIKLLS